MTPPTIGFIGFGEAGSTIAAGLRTAGVSDIVAFDIHANHPDRGTLIRSRGAATQTQLLASSEELAGRAAILICAVTASSAHEAALQTSPFLNTQHTYVDINSVSPALKQEIGKVIAGTGASFVEAAVMAPVSPYGHKVPMLLGGPRAEAFANDMRPFGMRLDVISSDVGKAAAVKMCRSIVVKGLEALLFECVLGANQFEVMDQVFASLQESYPGLDWPGLADYALNRVVVHGERRAHEMEEVAETLRSVGIDPIAAEATARRQAWSATLNLKESFGPAGPAGSQDVLEVINRRQKR